MVCCIAIHFSSFHMWDSKCYGNWHGSQWSCYRGVVVCGLVIYIHVCCFNDTAKSFSIVSGEIYYVRMTNNLCWDCNDGQQPFRILGNVTWKSDRQHSWGSMSWQHMNFIPETLPSVSCTYCLSCWPCLRTELSCSCSRSDIHQLEWGVDVQRVWCILSCIRTGNELASARWDEVFPSGCPHRLFFYMVSLGMSECTNGLYPRWQFFWVVFHCFKVSLLISVGHLRDLCCLGIMLVSGFG